jgi:hydroxymethylbilane synthase
MKNNTIRIGTRGSQLALWQAQQTRDALLKAYPHLNSEIVVIKTKGDIVLDVSLSKIGDKGLFTKEIEYDLINGDIDVAVHSLKDLPTELPHGLIIGGVLPRGEVRDVFVSKDGRKLAEMTANDRVGTSSLRRQSQVLSCYPHIQVVDIRGNVNTRIKKMNAGHCEGMIMAGAGLVRLGLEDLITEYIDPDVVMPAVSQGVVAIEIREDDDVIQSVIDGISDDDTWQCAVAERAFLRTLEGGCQVPVGCYIQQINHKMCINGMVASLDGTTLIRNAIECDPEEMAENAIELAFKILNEGGDYILSNIRIPE